MAGKMLYVASTTGHLNSFHLPYFQALSAQGWEIHTAARGSGTGAPGVVKHIDLPFEKRMTAIKNWQAAWQVAKLIAQERYDVVSVHTSLAAFFTRLGVILSGRRSKTLVWNTVHGYLFDENTPWLKKKIMLGAEQLTAGATDLLWTMNDQDTQLAQRYRLCKGEVHQTLGMGVDFTRFTPATVAMRQKARETLGLPQDAFVLVYGAEFSKRKNQTFLIRAMAKLPEKVHLLLPGRGETWEECRSLSQQLGVESRVHLCGFVSGIEQCYHAADLCVSPSRSEGLPFHMMEAMHCALPVVATRVKGHEDLVVPGETGELFPVGDEAAFCAQISSLVSQPALCLKLGYAGANRVKQYELDSVLEDNLEHFTEVWERTVQPSQQTASATVEK